MTAYPRIPVTQMEKDLARMFHDRVHKCSVDLIHRCMEADLPMACGPAIMASMFTQLGAKLTADLTTMSTDEYLRSVRAIFENARKEETVS